MTAESFHVVRAARLRAGAGHTLAAKRLRTHDGADLVAVDVGVADTDTLDDLLHAVVDARVQAESQTVATRIDIVDDAVDFAGPETAHVQHRPEDFALHVGDTVHLDHRGGDVVTCGGHRQALRHLALFGLLVDISADFPLRIGVDHRRDVGGQVPGIADGERVHRAIEHFQQALARFFLYVQQAQCRAALPGRLE